MDCHDNKSGKHWQDSLSPLMRFLDRVCVNGNRFRMWWRDDDSCRDTLELRKFLSATGTVPIALSVIPGLLQGDFVTLVNRTDNVSILQHGWKHINHSSDGVAPSEFPESRSPSEVSLELREGLTLLKAHFGDRFTPIFVPPWHSCASWLLEQLPELGYLAVSRDAPLFPLLKRGAGEEVNIEIDTSNWRAQGSFIGSTELVMKITRALTIRLQWSAPSMPIGILTHHALLTQSDCDCLNAFVSALEKFGVVEWVPAPGLIAATS